ncbi:MAG: ABC transporter ATP-binding protein [Lentisphaerae bacterium]|nr:ABC transporter ATP-binding protein [Lentisphaerota bacterium]
MNSGGLSISAEGVRKTYVIGKTNVPVLMSAKCEIAAGESVSVVGVSGAGKSTLLHVLGGLQRPDGGCVRIGGRDIYAITSGRRTKIRATQLGFVFQSYHLLPEMDVIENVMLPSRAMGGMTMPEMRRRAAMLLDTVGLRERMNHRPMELSGGEQQRVAIARALMNGPKILLADEPTGNLDGATGRQVLDYMLMLVKDHGQTMLLVTHNEQIAAMCDRVLRLSDGVLSDA